MNNGTMCKSLYKHKILVTFSIILVSQVLDHRLILSLILEDCQTVLQSHFTVLYSHH